jgi:hypothetical protein
LHPDKRFKLSTTVRFVFKAEVVNRKGGIVINNQKVDSRTTENV